MSQKKAFLLMRSECEKDQEVLFAVAMLLAMFIVIQIPPQCRRIGSIIYCLILLVATATACRSDTIAAITVKRETL
jgi:hypothetical protein